MSQMSKTSGTHVQDCCYRLGFQKRRKENAGNNSLLKNTNLTQYLHTVKLEAGAQWASLL